MNAWFLLPLGAFTASLVFFVYLVSVGSRDSIGRSFLAYTACVALLQAGDFLTWLPLLSDDWIVYALRIQSVFFMCLPFLLLNFAYRLVSKRSDFPYFVFLVGTIAFAFFSLTTDRVVADWRRYEWGVAPIMGTLYFTILLIFLLGIGAYFLVILIRSLMTSDDELARKQLWLVISGFVFIAVASITAGPVVSLYLKIHSIPMLVSSVFVIQLLFTFIAVTRYSFLAVGIRHTAHELFSCINDGAIILDRSGRVAEMNRPAAQLLNFGSGGPTEVHVNDLKLASYSFEDDFSDREMAIVGNDREHVVLLSQISLLQSGVLSGKLVILKDISERKRAEDEIGKLNEQLAHRVEVSTVALKDAREELVQREHKTEMANITSETLHNVKNILNSIKTSSSLLRENLYSASIKGFRKANALLRENMDSLENFIANESKGKMLMEYYLKLEESFDSEIAESADHIKRVMYKLDAVENIIVTQQEYAGHSLIDEVVVTDVLEDALTMQMGALEKYGISVEKSFAVTPKIKIQKIKFIHILINLIKNAWEAMLDVPVENRTLQLSILDKDSFVQIKVADTGSGISPKNLEKMFSRGFTTKKDGHGFGLHSCMAYMKEMGGTINAESEGEGKGSAFTLEFPV
ncbi:MAG: GHKL domain-containing protein [Proteobacteria bacterium]|nr:GHKL domain-containing protein [Pseudomonadota bacterium]